MRPDPESVRAALRNGGDEYHYRDDTCDIGGDRIHEGTVKVSHFIVKRDQRGQQIASTLLACLEDVLREDGIHGLEIEMGATECYTPGELAAERETREDETWQDPTYEFLSKNGFRDLDYVETYKWGLCVTGHKRL